VSTDFWPVRHISGRFGNESFQAITCTATDNDRKKRKKCYALVSRMLPSFSASTVFCCRNTDDDDDTLGKHNSDKVGGVFCCLTS